MTQSKTKRRRTFITCTAAGFVTTRWSVVLAAGEEESPKGMAALEHLCRAYWKPVYSFVRREGLSREEAQDITQAFFGCLLERRDFGRVRQEKGRFRSYLLAALKNFLINERGRAQAQKRGGGKIITPLEEIQADKAHALEPADHLSADAIFERRWAIALLEQVLDRLGKEYEEAGNRKLFNQLKVFLSDDPDRPSQADIGKHLGMTENAVKQAFHRLRLRYRQLLREELSHTVAAPGDLEDELRHLVAVLRG